MTAATKGFFARYTRFVRRCDILVLTVCLCLLSGLFFHWYGKQKWNLVTEAERAKAFENAMIRADRAHELISPAGTQQRTH